MVCTFERQGMGTPEKWDDLAGNTSKLKTHRF